MKKTLIILLLALSFSSTRANIATPQAFISEILVDSIGNWTIEMGFWEWTIVDIDSIMIETSTGSSKIAFFTAFPIGGYFDSLSIITNANLEDPISINPQGDFVKLISYAYGDVPFDFVAFGDYPGSQLDCIREKESVIFLSYIQSSGPANGFCIDISPTIGEENDTTGALGTFSGMAYDLSGNPFTEGFFGLPDVHNTAIFIQADGSFSERLCSRRFTFDTIDLMLPPWPWAHEIYTIEPVDFCLRPDSSHYQDIITTSLVIGIDDKDDPNENAVTLAPNPFSEKITFFFNIKNTDDSEVNLSIYSLDGREIHCISLSADQKRYEWAPGMAVTSGTYIYRLEKNNSIIKTGKFVRL